MGFTINPATGKLDVIRSFGVLDLRYLKLDCSNDPLTAALDLPELYNSLGDLKIMPDVQGNVTLFGDTSVGASAAVGKSLYLYKIYNTGSKYLRTYIDSTNQALFTTDCSTIWFNNSSGYMRLVGNTLYFDRTDGTIKGYAGNIVYGAGDISVEGGAGAYGNNDGGDLYLLGGSASGVGTDGSVIITGTVDWTGITGDIDVGSNAITTTGAVDASAYNITDKFITVATFTSAGIQAAITALGAEGGEVYLPEGEYDITSNISIAIDNVTIRGSGWGTILKNNTWGNWTGGADNTITVSGNYCNIKSLQIDGNSANTGETKYLLYITGTNCKVTDCFLQYSDYRGLLLGVACEARNNYVSNCDDAGIFLLGGGSQSIGNRTYGNGTNGIYVDGTNCSVIDNTVTSELGRGIYVDALDTRVIGNYITASADDGMYLSSSAENCVVSNNTFYGVANTKNDIKCVGDYNLISDNICNTYAGSSERGIYLDEADHCIVVNNMTYGHDTCGIQIDNDCDDTTVAGNSCQDTTPYVNNGTNSVFECSNSDITTTGTITSGYSVINQAADNLGVSISGFDDRSSNTLNAYIDASGDARLDSDSRHSILYINYSTGEGVDIGHTGTSTPLQVFGNITSDATIQGLTLTDGTATLTSGNFTTTGTLGAGPTTITAGATDLYPLKIDQGTTDLTSNSDSYGLWLDKDCYRTTYPATGGNTYGFYSDLYLNDDMDAPSALKTTIGFYSKVSDVTSLTGASTLIRPITTEAMEFEVNYAGSDTSTGSSGVSLIGAKGDAVYYPVVNKASGTHYAQVFGGNFTSSLSSLTMTSALASTIGYGISASARGAAGQSGTHSAYGASFSGYDGSYITTGVQAQASQQYGNYAISALKGVGVQVYNSNLRTGTVANAYGVYVENMDAEDGVFTNLYGIKINSPEKDGGSIGTYNALWIDDATVAGTNRGIVIDSDTIGLTLGAANDASIYYDGTDLIIDPKEVGTGVVNLNGATLTSGYSIINQATDSLGLSIFGYDDVVGRYVKMFVDNSGDAQIISNSTGGKIYFNYATGEGLQLGSVGNPSNLTMAGNFDLLSPGVGSNIMLLNPGNIANYGLVYFYTSEGTNANTTFGIIPRGTGAAGNRAQFSIFNTDFIADSTNYEFMAFRSIGTGYTLTTGKAGTGTTRPMSFFFDTTELLRLYDANGIGIPNDNVGIAFGAGRDARIWYNGTDMIIAPQIVGSGGVIFGYSADNVKTYWGAAKDASIYFDGSDWIFNSENITANDEVHFVDFDAYVFDATIKCAGDNIQHTFGTDGAADSYIQYTGSLLEIYGNGGINFTHRVIQSGTNLSAAGPTDDLDVSGVNIVWIDTNGNNVTLGGMVGGVDGQVIHIVVEDATNNTVLENAEGTGNQDIYLSSGGDETLTTSYGGWTLVCNGSNWYDVSH